MRPGDRFAHFEILEFIGQGSFGSVYRAKDLEGDRTVGLKLIRFRAEDSQFLEAERQGAVIQQQIAEQCDAVAAIHSFGEIEEYFYIAMEFVEGVDLDVHMREGALPQERAISIALQLSRALEIFHHGAVDPEGRPLRIVHGDLKPQNIRLQSGDRARLLDFGIAKTLRHERNQTRMVFGTLPYTAPEALDGEVVDLQSDLWALGVLLYEMVEGSSPFPGANEAEKRHRLMSGQPPEPLKTPNTFRLSLLLGRALAFDPQKRYSSARHLREDLERLQRGEPLAVEADFYRSREQGTRRADTWRATSSQTARTSSASTTRTAPNPTQPPTEDAPRPAGPPKVASPLKEASPLKKADSSPWRHLLLMLGILLLVLQIHAWQTGKRIDRDLASQPQDLTATIDRLAPWSWIDPLRLLVEPRKRLGKVLQSSLQKAFEQSRGRDDLEIAWWDEQIDQLDQLARMDSSSSMSAYVESRRTFCQGQKALLQAEAAWANRPGSGRQTFQQALAYFSNSSLRAPEWVAPHFGSIRAYSHDALATEGRRPLERALQETQARARDLKASERSLLIRGHLTLASLALEAEEAEVACADLLAAAEHCGKLASASRTFWGQELESLARQAENRLRQDRIYSSCGACSR